MEDLNMDELIKYSRELRAKFLTDPYRPGYHFVVPEGLARPFDPNGCIYWKGKYKFGNIVAVSGPMQDAGKANITSSTSFRIATCRTEAIAGGMCPVLI